MNSKYSKSSESHKVALNLGDKIALKWGDKYFVFSNASIYYRWKDIKKLDKNNESEISVQTCNNKFRLPDESYAVWDIQDDFDYVIKKKREALNDNQLIIIYINKIENWITSKIKSGYYLELLIPEMMNLLGSTEKKIIKDKK